MKKLIKNILKEYSINEGIKPHPKEEEFKQYQGIIDDIVYGIVNEDDLCGYKTEFFLNSGEDALQIVLYYKKGRYPGYDVFSEKQIEIKNTLETYLPIIEMAFVSYDSTRCKETIKEDTEKEKNLKVINTLLSQVSWEGLCNIWAEYNEKWQEFQVRSTTLYDANIFDKITEEIDFLEGAILSMGIKVTVLLPDWVDSCEGEIIKESEDSEIERNLKAINVLLSQVSWEGLCDMWVEYSETDGDYEIRSKTTASYFGDNDIKQELEFLESTIKSMGLRVFIFSPWYVENCEDEVKFMNESKETEPKYLSLIKELVEPFKDEEGVCDIRVSYDDDDDMYSVYIVMGTEEMNDKFFYVPMIQSHISKLRINVKTTIKDYLPIDNLYVGSYGKPNCNWNHLNESKEKSKKDLIERVLNDLVLPQYEHIICGFELKNVDDESLGNVINYPGVTVTFIGGYGTKMWPQTQAVQKMYDDVLDDIWETVWDYTGISLELYSKYIKDCGKENIYLRESKENYSPAGKEITPNKIVIHKSNPKVRDKILNEGLKVRAGECYKIYAGYGEKCIPAIFATNSTNKRASFDSTYDDDVWEINTEMIPDVKWYKDKHYESRSKHIVTFENIPVDAITLKHEGTGKDWGLMESIDKSEDNKLNESKEESKKEIIETILNTMVLPEYDHVICGFEVKEPNERFDFVGGKPFTHTSVSVTFIGGPGTKLWPQTPYIQDMYEDILNDIWDVIYNYTNEGVDMYYKTVKDCGKENIYLRESKEEDNKLKLVKDLIYTLFDEIKFIEIKKYNNKPLLKIYFESESVSYDTEEFGVKIYKSIYDYTGIIVPPSWAKSLSNVADFYLYCEHIEYDDEGNVIN